jgi:hypothetical protein
MFDVIYDFGAHLWGLFQVLYLEYFEYYVTPTWDCFGQMSINP